MGESACYEESAFADFPELDAEPALEAEQSRTDSGDASTVDDSDRSSVHYTNVASVSAIDRTLKFLESPAGRACKQIAIDYSTDGLSSASAQRALDQLAQVLVRRVDAQVSVRMAGLPRPQEVPPIAFVADKLHFERGGGQWRFNLDALAHMPCVVASARQRVGDIALSALASPKHRPVSDSELAVLLGVSGAARHQAEFKHARLNKIRF